VELIAGLSRDTIVVLEFLATMAFALSGVIGALRKRMDIVGICACGFLAAFGGGTLRDVLLERRPFFWVEHQYVLLGVLAISIAGATLVSRRRLEHGPRYDAEGWAWGFVQGVDLWRADWQPLLETDQGRAWYRPIGLLGEDDFGPEQDV